MVIDALLQEKGAVFRIRNILVRIRIWSLGPVHMITDFQDANKLADRNDVPSVKDLHLSVDHDTDHAAVLPDLVQILTTEYRNQYRNNTRSLAKYKFEGTVSRDGFGLRWHVWLVLGLDRGRGNFF
jgi:hypothetical protein